MSHTVSAPEVKKPDRPALTGGVAAGDQVILSGQMAYDPDIDGIPNARVEIEATAIRS